MKKHFTIIVATALAASFAIFAYCYYIFNSTNVNITMTKINKMDVQSNVQFLQNKLRGYSQKDIKALILSIGVCSKITSEMFGWKDDETKKEQCIIVDTFTRSFREFVFSREDGFIYVLTEDIKEHKHIKEFMATLFEFSLGTLKVSEMFLEEVLIYEELLDNLLEKEDVNVTKCVRKTLICFDEDDYSMYMQNVSLVLGAFLLFYNKQMN